MGCYFELSLKCFLQMRRSIAAKMIYERMEWALDIPTHHWISLPKGPSSWAFLLLFHKSLMVFIRRDIFFFPFC